MPFSISGPDARFPEQYTNVGPGRRPETAACGESPQGGEGRGRAHALKELEEGKEDGGNLSGEAARNLR